MDLPPEASSLVTLKDIALKLNVSVSSVSRALRGSHEISPALQARVGQAAKALGYQPNPMGAALARFKRSSPVKPIQAELGWINFWPNPKDLRRHLEFERYWQGAVACAKKFGYRLEEFAAKDFGTSTRLEKVLHSRGIRGLLLPPGKLPDPWKGFAPKRFSIVHLGRISPEFPVHSVSSDQTGNGILALKSIRERGYKRIGFVSTPWEGSNFGAGFLWAQRTQLPEEMQIPPLIEWHMESFEDWFKSERPDAIFTDQPTVLNRLRQLGARIPEDVGLAASSTLDCPIDAGIYQNAEEIGRVAILVLISLMHDNDCGTPTLPRQILVPGQWVDGSMLPTRN